MRQSEGYKILCRFFKEKKIWWLFTQYQCADHSLPKVSLETKNPLKDFGTTHFSTWVKRQGINLGDYGLITPWETLCQWLKEKYPSYYTYRGYGIYVDVE